MHETYQTYTVKSGDTLSKIAVKFKTTVGILARINRIADPNRIYVGQRLKVPAVQTVSLPPKAQAIVNYINQKRIVQGRAPLTVDSTLTSLATTWANHLMATPDAPFPRPRSPYNVDGGEIIGDPGPWFEIIIDYATTDNDPRWTKIGVGYTATDHWVVYTL